MSPTDSYRLIPSQAGRYSYTRSRTVYAKEWMRYGNAVIRALKKAHKQLGAHNAHRPVRYAVAGYDPSIMLTKTYRYQKHCYTVAVVEHDLAMALAILSGWKPKRTSKKGRTRGKKS